MIDDLDLKPAAYAACRAVWAVMHGGDFDEECPDKATWIAEEKEALEPAVPYLEAQIRERIACDIEAKITPGSPFDDGMYAASVIVRQGAST